MPGTCSGALSPAERREFEEHLPNCLTCQFAVSELAAHPGLLAQVSPADAAMLSLVDDAPGEYRDWSCCPTHRPRRIKAERHGRTWQLPAQHPVPVRPRLSRQSLAATTGEQARMALLDVQHEPRLRADAREREEQLRYWVLGLDDETLQEFP
jgi:hypothetical protein